jgi:sporulation protein YlmC with PRC-barrel domain
MLVLASQIQDSPILSIRNGHPVAMAGSMLINADKLEIAALFCKSPGWRGQDHVLLLRDIREYSRSGIIIDSLEDIEDIGEIVRLGDIVERNYQVIGKHVVTESGTKLGKVEDYSVDTLSNAIQKLYVKPSLLKNLMVNNLVIDRVHIIKTEDDRIIVSDASLASPAQADAEIAPA